MKKALVTSDWQLCSNPRDAYRLNWVENELPKLIDKYQPEHLLVLGDLTEEKDAHPAALVNRIVSLFDNLRKKCKIIILEGNHDYLHEGFPFFEFISHFKDISWISGPTELERCLFLPHTRDYKEEWGSIKLNGYYNYIFAHNIFEGATAAGRQLSGIPQSIFADDACVISGDVHEPQTTDKVTYVGAPYLCDFGDSYQPRVLLLDDFKIKSIKTIGPQKRLLEVNWTGFSEERGLRLRPKGYNEGDILKVRVHLQMNDVAHWDKIRAQIVDAVDGLSMIPHTVQPVVAYDQGARTKIAVSMKKSDDKYLSSFVKRWGVDEDTAATGKSLMEG